MSGGADPASLVELLRERAGATPDGLAVTFLVDGEGDERSMTYAALDARARAIGAHLQSRGAQGARALLLYPPGNDYVAAFFGCLYAGVVAVPAYPPVLNRPSSQVGRFVTDAGAEWALTIDGLLSVRDQLERQEPELAGVEWLATDTIGDEAAEQWREPRTGSDSLAFIQYSSGSTSAPKGVMLSHANLLVNSALMYERVGLSPQSVTISWLPPYHDAGLIGKVITPIRGGFRTILMSPLAFLQRPVRWLDAITRYRGTCSAAPNFAWDLCARKVSADERGRLDLSSWRQAMNTGEPIRAATLERFAKAFESCGFGSNAFYPCYGLAESTVMVTGPDPSAPVVVHRLDRERLRGGEVRDVDAGTGRELVGCGRALPGHTVAIVDPATREPCADRVIGEIWAAGPSIARGYWGMPQESNRSLAARHPRLPGRFLRTGDLGYLDDGELFVTGRLKDVIVLHGRNYYPQDVEQTVEQVGRGLRAGCGAAFAVEHDGAERLVVVNEVDRGRVDEPSELLAAVRAAIVDEHGVRPHAIVLIERGSLPKTSSGKQRRRATRELLLSSSLEVVARWEDAVAAPDRPRGQRRDGVPSASVARALPGRAEIERRLVATIAARTGADPAEVRASEPFGALGIGSIDATAIIGELADWLGRDLEPSLPWDFPSAARLARHLTGEEPRMPRRPEPEQPAEPLAVVGMACRFPGASDVEQLRALLLAGANAIVEVPSDRWDAAALYDPDPGAPDRMVTRHGGFIADVDRFDAAFFGISPREARDMDPQQRLLAEVAWEALEDAGHAPPSLEGHAVGVFIGIGTADYAQIALASGDGVGAYSGTGNAHSIAANRLSYLLDLRGPSVAVDSACSSSLVALHMACESVRAGESEMAIVGGVNVILLPQTSIALSKASMLAPDGLCKPFDASADGYGRGEGCGVVLIRPLRDALDDGDRIYAVVRGSAVGQDGLTSSLTAPSGLAQQSVIARALRRAAVSPAEVGYVEAHGTGTAVGDPIEIAALQAVLDGGDDARPCAVGSIKANIGHLEAAAGIAGVIKTALALSHAEVYPNGNLVDRNPRLSLDGSRIELPTRAMEWAGTRIAGVSSFGFGGTNAHAVLAEPPARTPRRNEPERPLHLLMVSARTETALRTLAGRVERRLVRSSQAEVADLCATINRGRATFGERLAVVGATPKEIAAELRCFMAGAPTRAARGSVSAGSSAATAFVFPGQGAQYAGMTRELYETSPPFRRTIDESAEILRDHLDVPLPELLFSPDHERLEDTRFAQPALFAVEHALATLLLSWGLRPDVLLGHSVGEYVAACVGGALSHADAVELVALRGRLMGELPADEASMVSVLAPFERVAPLIDGLVSEVAVAALNGPNAVTVSGRRSAVDELSERLRSDGVAVRRLAVSHAFHSPLIEPVLDRFEQGAKRFEYRSPSVAVVSNVTGAPYESDFVPDASYWRRHARATVRFADGVLAADSVLAACTARGPHVFVEVGPPALTGLGRRVPDGAQGAWLATLAPGAGDWVPLLEAVARVATLGADLDWDGFERGYARARVAAPTYPFERRRHWVAAEPHLSHQAVNGGAPRQSQPSTATAHACPPPNAAGEPPDARLDARVAAEPLTRSALLAMPAEARPAAIARRLRDGLARVLLTRPDDLGFDEPLTTLGVDSIVVLEIGKRIEDELQLPLPPIGLADGATITTFASALAQLLDTVAAP